MIGGEKKRMNGYAYAMRCDIGTREEQQDAIDLFDEENDLAAVVCDGMGGLDGGRMASTTTASELLRMLKNKAPEENIADLFIQSIDILDEKVLSFLNEEGEKLNAGTTVVSVYIERNQLNWMSVGDSRLYILRGNDMLQATRDHNYFLTMKSMNASFKPTEEDLKRGDALTSFIGMGGISIMDISTNPLQLYPKDCLILTTDGLTKALSDRQIQMIMQTDGSVEERADRLLEAAKIAAPDSRDNTSFILIEVQ